MKTVVAVGSIKKNRKTGFGEIRLRALPDRDAKEVKTIHYLYFDEHEKHPGMMRSFSFVHAAGQLVKDD